MPYPYLYLYSLYIYLFDCKYNKDVELKNRFLHYHYLY